MWANDSVRKLTVGQTFYFNRHLTILFLFILSNGYTVLPVSPFNIDTQYPIILKSIQGTGFGTRSVPNYFGASINLFKPEQSSYSWIVIGAPKANSTHRQHHDIPEPGAILQCTLGREPVEICRPVVMDPTGNYHNGDIHEWKNGSLIGAPNGMALSSKSFVACASRLERWHDGRGKGNTTISYMHGSCYVRPRSHLFIQPQQQISRGVSTEDLETNYQRLNPLQNGKYEGKREDRYGQAGFAVHFSKSGSELVMSAPGLNRWMGSVIQYVSRDGGVNFEKSFVSEAAKCAASGVGCFNYFGYSLASGYFYDRDITTVNNAPPIYYAAGVPRANSLAGKVVVFRFPNDPDGSLEIQQEILGNQTGAYFGSSLLALDLNGDGFEDLVVGSPRFSRDQNAQLRLRAGPFAELTLEGKGFDRFGGYGDEGAVFVFFSTNGGRGKLIRQQLILRGGNRPWSHFGTAIASLGDLNRDGYNDFVVSAPFEDNSGAVYIYHGNKDGITTHAQVIIGKQIDSTIGGFGFSLAGNEDIDNNGFPDISIGSFNSSQVVVLRAKPIINVHGAVKCAMSKLPLNVETFTIESCVSFIGDYVPSKVNLKISLLADANFLPHRVGMRRENSFGNKPSSYLEYTQSIAQSDGEICAKFHVIVNEFLESSGAPLAFRQTVSIDSGDKAPKPRYMMIPSKTEDMYTSGPKFSDFCKTCPLMNTGKPESFLLELPLAIPCGDDDHCQSDLYLEVNFVGADVSSGRFIVGSSSSITMEIQLSNRNETAIQPAVLVTWWKLKLKRNPADCSPYSGNGNQITYRCSFGKFLENGQTALVSLEFDMTSLVVLESGQMDTELFWNVTATTVSELPGPVSKTVGLPLSYQADPHMEASRRLEVFNSATLAPYVVFTHVFEMSMDGPSPVAEITAEFHLPVNVTTENNGTIVNVRGVKSSGETGTTSPLSCKTTKGHFSKSDDALGFDDDDVEDYDPDFDAAGIGGLLPKEKDVSRDSNSTFVENDRLLLHCQSPFVSCMVVECKTVAVYYPGTTTVITFIMDVASEDIRRLMKTHKVSSIQVESHGILKLSPVVNDIQPKPHKADEATAITLIEKEGHKPISKWIFILAVVIGILVLACVAFCLYSCGCFEEKQLRRDDNGDAVDGGASSEEMQPLHNKQEKEETKNDNNSGENKDTDDGNENANRFSEAIPTSPFSDVTDPPEFVPTEPTIPEESENENDYEEAK